MLIAATGLVPILCFNLNNALSSVGFYLIDRHPWEFQQAGYHIFKQAGLVTPPLYLCFLLTLLRLFKQAQRQEAAALLFSVSITNLLVYMLLAPWTDANSTSVHWPLSGYFPLLVALPDTLSQVGNWIEQRRTARRERRGSYNLDAGLYRYTYRIGWGGLSGLSGTAAASFGKGVLSNSRWPVGNPSVSIPVKCYGASSLINALC